MAKNAILGMKTGGGVMAKLVDTAVVLAILVIVVKHPSDAAEFVKTVFGWDRPDCHLPAGASPHGMTTMTRSWKDRNRAPNGADRYAVLGRKRPCT